MLLVCFSVGYFRQGVEFQVRYGKVRFIMQSRIFRRCGVEGIQVGLGFFDYSRARGNKLLEGILWFSLVFFRGQNFYLFLELFGMKIGFVLRDFQKICFCSKLARMRWWWGGGILFRLYGLGFRLVLFFNSWIILRKL